jgi:transglutaminase-like putative cysteine protease
MLTLARRLSIGTQISAESQRLYAAMAALAIALVPHLLQTPPWIPLLLATIALWRVTIEIRAWRLPPRWIRTLIAVATMAAVIFTFRRLNGLEAGTALLTAMTGIKLLESRGLRDCTILIFIGYVLLFSALLYDQSLSRLPYIIIAAWVLTAALLRIHLTDPMRARTALRTTGAMILQALPVAALLFLFFPRLPGQFWALPARGSGGSGLTDEMVPGDISALTLSSDPAFRVKFAGEPPLPADRYWRGPVLHDFDGRRWRSEQRFIPLPTIESTGAVHSYRITIEPTQRPWIFALDVPTQWPADLSTRTYDLQLIARRPLASLASFDLVSQTRFQTSLTLPRSLRAIDTALPGTANPRTRKFAATLRESSASDWEYIQAVLRKFRQEEFYYTLKPDLLGEDSVDDFLFRTRRGFCEHFASAFTTLVRAANIPARVVTGYQGGEYNSLGDYLLVRQSDAHAWSEVWLEDRGWVRVDPTAAVAPQRVERNLDAAIAENESLPGRFLRQSQLLARARLALDAVNNFWNDRIVQYNELQQRSLLAMLGIDNTDWRALGIAFGITLAAFFAALTAYLGWQYRPRKHDPIATLYTKLCTKLARAKLPRELHEGPVDYLQRVANVRPQSAEHLHEICGVYVDLRYGPAPQLGEVKRLRELLKRLTL